MTLETIHWQRAGGRAIDFTRLGFGTAPLGNLYRAISEDAAQASLERAWTAGIRYFDTAPLYGFGLAETRLNHFLRGRRRDDYVLSSKVGRLLSPADAETRSGADRWFEVPARREIYDYGYDGVMRSLEASLERLGLDRIDILYAHDLDRFNHGGPGALEVRLEEFMAGGYRALLSLREQGVIAAFGAGVNQWQPCQWLAERGDFDLFLLAGRYTLLEQEALDSFLPLCVARGIGIVIGGPYNSGILATGPRPGAYYNYDPAPPGILERVRQIEALCTRHDTPLIAAALQFPLHHPAVVSVIPGGQGPEELAGSLAALAHPVPPALWEALRAAGFLRTDAPAG